MNANGRVNILEQPTSNVFSLYDKIPINENTSEYRQAMKGTFENTELSNLYFSKQNIDTLQNSLIKEVYKHSGGRYQIGYQDSDTLKIIMRSIFLQYAEFDMNNITKEVSKLNKLVLDYAVPSVYNEAVGYMKYREDQSTLAVPMELPQQSDREHKQLELRPFV